MTDDSEANGINRTCCCGCGQRVPGIVMHTCSISNLPVFAGWCLSKEGTAKAPCVNCQRKNNINDNSNNCGTNDDDSDGDGDNNNDNHNDEDKGNIPLVLLSSLHDT
jgi:hypothetical protein